MAKTHHKPSDYPSTSSSSNEEEEEYTTIFSSEEDEPKKKNEEEEEVLGSKRRSEVTPTDMNSKRAKKTRGSRFYQNRWTEEDEIALLQGIIDFKDATGKSPFEDRLGFIESVKKEISVEANVRQYMDKIRHLKRKYVKKRKIFVKAHNLKCADLSKLIWGDEVNSDVKRNERKKKKKQDLTSSPNSSKVVKHGVEENSNVKSNWKSKKQDLFSSPNGKIVEEEEEEGDVTNTDWFENSFLVGLVESLGVDSVKKKWSLVSIESKKKLEENLKLLQSKELECKKIEEMLKAKEVECVRQRSDLLNEVISVITESN